MIPTHLADGRLPAGFHQATWSEVVERFGFSPRRQALLRGLLAGLMHLREAGCERVYVGGSFVRTKPNPGDVDVVWSVVDVDPDRLNPMFLDFDAGRTMTKVLFGTEFFPSALVEAASGLPFAEFFQWTRQGQRCGVVVVDLATLDE